jgi:hypothetical protein
MKALKKARSEEWRRVTRKLIMVAGLSFFALCALYAEGRERAVDFRIVLDMSGSFRVGHYGAVNYLCDSFVDDILEEQDTLYLVAAKEEPEVLFDGNVGGGKADIKMALWSLDEPFGISHADEALAIVESRVNKSDKDRINVTLLICGTDTNVQGEYLKYSRTKNFAYWREITVGFNLQSEIDNAYNNIIK